MRVTNVISVTHIFADVERRWKVHNLLNRLHAASGWHGAPGQPAVFTHAVSVGKREAATILVSADCGCGGNTSARIWMCGRSLLSRLEAAGIIWPSWLIPHTVRTAVTASLVMKFSCCILKWNLIYAIRCVNSFWSICTHPTYAMVGERLLCIVRVCKLTHTRTFTLRNYTSELAMHVHNLHP